MADTSGMERCANCGGIIGKLETPCVWRGRVVCSACDLKLRVNDGDGPTSDRPLVGEAVDRTGERVIPYARRAAMKAGEAPGPRDIICPNPNCGYSGRGKTKGDPLGCAAALLPFIGIGLLFLQLPIGAGACFIGFVGCVVGWLCSPARYYCPQCGIRAK